MCDLCVICLLFKGENMFKSHLNKIRPQSPEEILPMEHQFLHLIMVPLV
jgi:hypothetical protein